MTGPSRAGTPEALLQRALATLRALRKRVDDLESSRREPIAIIGMACRFPGPACDLDGYWKVLEGAPATGRLDQRFDPAAVHGVPQDAGLLPSIADFDASIFAIAPKEAASLDPQQRLLLELAWEALEHAGYAPTAPPVQPVGVFVGLASGDFRDLIRPNAVELDSHSATGSINCLAAGRIAYTFGFVGPAMVVDTACSSSLTAVHLACQSLRQGESRLALAGGVHIIASPLGVQLLAKTGMLSPTGECRPFDARANGFMRGEGGGILVLKRLRDALADRDQVLAVIRGSAINQNGRSTNLTSPNVASQILLLQTALQNAGVDPARLTYIEAHATGTALGDPIEVEAIREVIGETDGPRCYLGSVKANIGHLEAASGIAGLAKIILSMRHRRIPGQPNFERLNPDIPLDGSRLAIPTSSVPWSEPQPLVAGVSSFGISGANAHVIVEEAPAPASAATDAGGERSPEPPSDRRTHVLAFSARSREALAELAARYRTRLAALDAPRLADACYTINSGRAHFRHRAAIVAGSAADMVARLDAIAIGATASPGGIFRSAGATGFVPRVAFLFPAEGSLYEGMARGLFEAVPAVRRTLETCDQILRTLLGGSLLEAMFGAAGAGGEASLLHRTAYADPAIFALEVAIAQLWISWGVQPVAVLGDGLGEVAAACIAGVFSLEDGLRLTAQRGALTHAGDVSYQSPRIPIVSSVTGRTVPGPEIGSAAYWRAHTRAGVLCGDRIHHDEVAAGVRSLVDEEGTTALVAVGPTAGPSGLAGDGAGATAAPRLLPSLRRGADDVEVMLESLAALYVAGAEVSWDGFDRDFARRRVAMPTYPFQRKRLWFVSDAAADAGKPSSPLPAASRGPQPVSQPEPRPELLPDPAAAPARAAWEVPDAAQVEEVVRDAVAAVMHLEPAEIDPRDSFQAMGLDSLMAFRLRSRLRETLGVLLPMVSFLGGASIASLTAHLVEMLAQRAAEERAAEEDPRERTEEVMLAPVPALPQIAPRPSERHQPFPFTDLQQAYVLGRSGAFELGNISTYFLVEFDGSNIDLDRLEDALGRLIDRHDMLRAVVLPDGTQKVLERVPAYEIRRTDLRSLDTESREQELLEIRRQMFDRTVDGTTWPLFEVRVSRTAGSRVRLHIGLDALFVDGWSMSLLLREWSAIYRGEEQTLPALSLSYRDYVQALAALEQSDTFEHALAYWQARVPTLPPPPDLPLARDPASVRKPRFTHRQGRLDAVSWARFKRRAFEHGLTPSAALCTAYAEILAGWSGSWKFTLNVLGLGRLPIHPQVPAVVGNFTSTMLLEVDLIPGQPFVENAGRLQHQLWSDLSHGLVSGVRVLRDLNRTQKNAGRAAMPVVFASLLGLDGAEREGDESRSSSLIQFAGVGDDPREVHHCVRTPQVWLDHQVAEDAGELVFNWDAVEELFPDRMVADAFEAYLHRLEALAGDAAAWSSPAGDVAPASHLAARAEANLTAAPMREALLHDPFLERVAEDPMRVAVISPQRTLRYGDLDRLSERVAVWLRARGAGPGRLVVIAMEKGWEQIVAALAVLKAGAAYVPVDPGLPPERLLHLLRHTETDWVLNQSHVDARIEWPDRIARLAVDLCDRLEDAIGRLPPAAGPRDLAYVIYTSGSTGVPKGVMVEHRSALNTILDVNERLAVTRSDRVLGLSSLSFDLSVYDIFGMLAAGAALVLPAPADAREPARWLAQIRSEGVTLWNSVPALMEMLVDHVAMQSSGEHLPLRAVMMSGDWIPLGLPPRLARVAPEARCVSLGGATEASIWSIWHPIERIDPAWPSIPYGRPMRNQRFEVLDAVLRPRPVWVPGDLYIAGEGLARGYWRDEEKTAASFIVHPGTGERLYRTGDLGRYHSDGTIEFLGRADFQVKIGGYRIELGEIEAALAQIAGVRSAVATATGERGARRLVAYVAPEPGACLTEAGILAALRAKIPAYAIPQQIVQLEALPLSANGKVDRRALPDPNGASGARSFVAARTETERALIGFWTELLDSAEIGVTDNFFELGGHSLLAVRLMGLIQRRWGAALPLSTLFEHPSIEKLAALIDRDAGPRATLRTPLIAMRKSGRRPPLFFAHPVGGDVLCYADLAAAMDADQPFYGLQSVDAAVPAAIEDMAAAYVAALRERQPRGPYRIGGWSMGGVVAFEMGQQLRRAGEQIELLVLLDVTMAPRADRPGIDDARVLAVFARDLAGLTRRQLGIDDSRLRTMDEAERLAHVLDRARMSAVLPPELDPTTFARYFERFRRNYRAMLAYQASPFDGPILFLRAREDGADRAVAEAWANLATSSAIVEVEGDHYAVTRRDSAPIIASLISAWLDSAGPEGPGRGAWESAMCCAR